MTLAYDLYAYESPDLDDDVADVEWEPKLDAYERDEVYPQDVYAETYEHPDDDEPSDRQVAYLEDLLALCLEDEAESHTEAAEPRPAVLLAPPPVVWYQLPDDHPTHPGQSYNRIDLASIFRMQLEALKAELARGPSTHATAAWRAYRERVQIWVNAWVAGQLLPDGFDRDPVWRVVAFASHGIQTHFKQDVWGSPEGIAYTARRAELGKTPAAKAAHRNREARRRKDPAVRAANKNRLQHRRAGQSDADKAKEAERKRLARAKRKAAQVQMAEILAAIDSMDLGE